MKIYKWIGHGVNSGAVIIVIAETLKSAKMLIYATMIDCNMPRSLDMIEDIKEIDILPHVIVHLHTGNFSPQ